MKGENLQSPEHKQGESPGKDQHQPGLVSVTRQLELSRITENTSHGSGPVKEGEKSVKTSPVHLEINKTSNQVNKNSLHIEVNLPLPATAKSSSPETKLMTEAKILQLSEPDRAGSKPCVVIPPPPQVTIIPSLLSSHH